MAMLECVAFFQSERDGAGVVGWRRREGKARATGAVAGDGVAGCLVAGWERLGGGW